MAHAKYTTEIEHDETTIILTVRSGAGWELGAEFPHTQMALARRLAEVICQVMEVADITVSAEP